jgi:hypothetical protein
MNLSYQFTKLNTNLENKILLKNLFIKFFIRNKIDKTTYIIENEFFFFNIEYSTLKKNIQIKKKSDDLFIKNKKQNDFIKKINKKQLKDPHNKIIFNTVNNNNNLSVLKNKNILKNINLIGISVNIKEALLNHKNYKNLQIYFFLKKRIFINILKFQFLFYKIFFKILEIKMPLIGSITKIIKGGYICEVNFLTIKAYLSNSCFQNQEKKYRSINNFEIFYNIKQNNDPIENILIFYSFCFLKNINLNLTLLWNSNFFFTNKVIFPLYFYVITKFLNKESKLRVKNLFKLKKLKKYGKLKKKKSFMVRRKFRFKTLKIFLSTQSHFEKKKNIINREILLDTFEKKCKILVNKIINKSK